MIKHNNLLKAIGVLFFIVILVTSCKTSTRGENPVLLKVLWSKKDTSHNNYRIPSIIVTKQNTLLAFSEGREKGDSGNIDILLFWNQNAQVEGYNTKYRLYYFYNWTIIPFIVYINS